jgi:hypothetical protein
MNWVAAIGVNFLVPLLGAMAFVFLCRLMRQTQIQSPPFFAYFILFATFGGWLMVCLTTLFWKWSGMASLGVFFLILVAPFVTAGAAFNLRSRRVISRFHWSAYAASIAYSALTLTALGGWLGVHLLVG